MDYAKGIRKAREKAKLSQRALGRAIDMDPGFVNMLESGTRQPSVGTIDKIARACNVMGLEIFEWSAPKKMVKKGARKP
jgi:transcriptional regulator with XRE-family HTH domain